YLNVFHSGGFDYQHEPFMLAYILLQGQAQLKFMNGDRLELQQGDLVLLPAGSAHHVSCPNNADFSEHHAINPYFQSHAQQCVDLDRKSTRLNSSHVKISYAVFCLKKKKKKKHL